MTLWAVLHFYAGDCHSGTLIESHCLHAPTSIFLTYMMCIYTSVENLNRTQCCTVGFVCGIEDFLHQTAPWPSIVPLPWMVMPLWWLKLIHWSRPDDPHGFLLVGAIMVPSTWNTFSCMQCITYTWSSDPYVRSLLMIKTSYLEHNVGLTWAAVKGNRTDKERRFRWYQDLWCLHLASFLPCCQKCLHESCLFTHIN